jgi:4-hydroxy-tetrahydrodipicolinate reductase
MLPVVVIGLGPIGLGVASAVRADRTLRLAGLVDIDPTKTGKSLDQLVGGKSRSGPRVVRSLDDAMAAKPKVAIVTTTSRFPGIVPTLKDCARRRLHVVSSCEEMSYPQYLHPALSRSVDGLARRSKVAMVGTGVNPGFVMDFLPVVLSSMVAKVTGVKVVRRVDASTRRKPLQEKVGSTLTVQEFNARKRAGNIGHMGIAESVAMIARGLGREARKGSVKVGLEPVIAQVPMDSLLGRIQPGQVCGMRNKAHWKGKGLEIELDLVMAIGTKDPHDRVELAGPVPLSLRIDGGTPGDTATVAAMLNAARVLPRATPGLHTMLTLPVAGCEGR